MAEKGASHVQEDREGERAESNESAAHAEGGTGRTGARHICAVAPPRAAFIIEGWTEKATREFAERYWRVVRPYAGHRLSEPS